jgi:azurin
MKKFKMKSLLFVFAFTSATFVGCSSPASDEAVDNNSTMGESEVMPKEDTVRINLGSNDSMKFDMTEINVFEGQIVVLTLQHNGTMPINAMGHNFVLLTQGTSVADFATEAVTAPDNQYIPANSKSIIAHTKLLGGGESDVITFAAPQKGTYDFLCSFPGHYSMMSGKFNVK